MFTSDGQLLCVYGNTHVMCDANCLVFCFSSLPGQAMRGGDGKAGFLIRNPAGQVILPYQWQESAEHEDNSVKMEGKSNLNVHTNYKCSVFIIKIDVGPADFSELFNFRLY